MSDYTRIYLQPECCANPDVGRLWCQDDEPETCPDGEKWVPYILQSEYARLQSEIEALRAANRDLQDWFDNARAEAESLQARADACQQEAQIWKQEARTQSAIVAEIYQELTGKTGEPGDWNGARPLKPAILRKQAEAVDRLKDFRCVAFGTNGMAIDILDITKEAQRLRQQAGEADKEGCKQ